MLHRKKRQPRIPAKSSNPVFPSGECASSVKDRRVRFANTGGYATTLSEYCVCSVSYRRRRSWAGMDSSAKSCQFGENGSVHGGVGACRLNSLMSETRTRGCDKVFWRWRDGPGGSRDGKLNRDRPAWFHSSSPIRPTRSRLRTAAPVPSIFASPCRI